MNGSGAYRSLLRPLLFLLDPETAHNLAMAVLRGVSGTPLLLKQLNRFRPPSDPVTVAGISFPNRIGLAAGFDKNGLALPAWAALGFGFIEIGTVTARPQPGNPKPRIFRLPECEALINRLGFNNDGADVVANRLRQWHERGLWPQIPVGINIGKSKSTDLAQATADYLQSFRRLQTFADYVVLNVSSPNTPGLRALQEAELLSELLQAVQEENRARKRIFVKIAPDLSEAQLAGVVTVCATHDVAGIIATNTTLDHSSIPPRRDEAGGLSGAPLRDKSTNLLHHIAAQCSIPLIGCGGITDGVSARARIEAGAALVQIYTGLIYRGPGLIREIGEALARRG